MVHGRVPHQAHVHDLVGRDARLAGGNLVVIGSFYDYYYFQIFGKPTIQNPADLKGKVIAATAGRYLGDVASYKTVSLCWSAAAQDGPLLDELLDFNQRVISCYQGFTGVTHHEIWVTSEGCCHCEIAARAGGGGITACFESRTGVNLRQVAVQAQLDGSVSPSIEVASHLTGWAVIHAGPGVLREPIKVPDEPWVVAARALAQPGSRLEAPDSCSEGVAVVSVRGNTEAEVTHRLREAVKMTSIKVSAASTSSGPADPGPCG